MTSLFQSVRDGKVGRAARLLRIARTATGVSAGELTASAGCAESLVTGIENGKIDPTLDTVNRLVNSVGLEVRAGPQPVGSVTSVYRATA